MQSSSKAAPQTSVTSSVLTGDIALQKAKVLEARQRWTNTQLASEKTLISSSEAWDILTTERRILYYMECTEAAFDFMEDGYTLHITV